MQSYKAKNGAQQYKPAQDWIISAVENDENAGFCLACGDECDGVEPDARRYECDACGAHTFPYIQVQNNSAMVEHEATTSKIGEDQLFYFAQRGIGPEEAVSMIINGFVKEVFTQLPMEFAVEATKLLGLKLEGSVG